MHGITDSKSLLQTVKLLFLSVKPLTGGRPTRDREAYNVVEIYLVCWWMSARMEHLANELISVSSVGVCHYLTTKPRQNKLSPFAFATVWENSVNSSCQSTPGQKLSFLFLVCQKVQTQ